MVKYTHSVSIFSFYLTKKRPPKYNAVVLKYWANISEIFTTKFSTYLYIVRKYSWKCNVKIVFYYIFLITHNRRYVLGSRTRNLVIASSTTDPLHHDGKYNPSATRQNFEK